MKKLMRSALLRALCVGALGVLLLVYSGEMSRWIVIACGSLFILLGAISGLTNVIGRKDKTSFSVQTTIVSLGSILFGVVQLLFPELFFAALRYVLSALVCLLAVAQSVSLVKMRRKGIKWSAVYHFLPLVGIAVGLFVAFYKGFTATGIATLRTLGAVFVAYALLEFWMLIKVKRMAKLPAETEQVEVLEDLENS